MNHAPVGRSRRTIAVLVVVAIAIAAVGIGGPLAVAAQETTTNNTTAGSATTPTGTSGNVDDTASPDGQTIAVKEYEDGEPAGCVAVQPLGNGTQAVEKFYGYEGAPDLSAVGSRNIQYTDTSQIFFYNGTEGLSVVMIHDRYGDNTPGGDVNMTFTNLPDGQWIVRDDSPAAPFSADEFSINEHSATIRWSWGGQRTDGGVFRAPSRSFDDVRLVPEFNDSEQNIRAWGLRSADRENLIRLDMGENISFSTGSCPSRETTKNQSTETGTPTISLNSGGQSGDSNGRTTPIGNASNDSGGSVVGEPQAFVVTNLSVDRETVASGQPVNITATIENQADRGLTRTIVFRTSENTTTERTIALNPGERQFVQFQHSYDSPGTYTLRAGAATATIKVSSSTTGPGFGVLPAALAVLFSAFLVRKRISNGFGNGTEGEAGDETEVESKSESD